MLTGDASDGGVPTETAFRVVTWNVENFFDSRNDPDTGDEVYNGAQVNAKISQLATVLNAIDADFVALQEVENLSLLQRLVMEGLPERGYVDWGLMDGFDGRGIDVAFISRFPVDNVVSQLGESFEGPTGERQFFTRDAVEAFVNVNGTTVVVMTSHFLSQVTSGSETRRLGEAIQAQDILRRRIGSYPRVLFAGDMNDNPGSPPYDAMGVDGVLTDLTLQVPADDRWTYIYRGMTQLDYMFASEEMAADLVGIQIMHNADVEVASDHYPVVANFRIDN